MGEFHYQVGGSLTGQAPSYIQRSADDAFYAALKRGEFCYVLNSRQMGKSSLLVQIRHRLQEEGAVCAVLDMTNIGSDNITPLQWYKGLVTSIWRGFRPLRKFDLKAWWLEVEEVSLLQRLSLFISDVLLPGLPDQEIIIFIDEIDSTLSLPFPIDDFFAFIRFCYNQRALDDRYMRLHFSIFGVAKPSDLIQDRVRTPFNIGTAIALEGFSLSEAMPLTAGFQISEGSPQAVLEAILDWTNGQPFLTQKLCQLVIRVGQESMGGLITVPPGHEAYWVETLVRKYVLQDWETQDEPEHLRTIYNRILSDSTTAGRLLGLYQQVLQGSDPIASEDSGNEIDDSIGVTRTTNIIEDQQDLMLSGLVIWGQNQLQVKNKIYGTVFNESWVQYQLHQLRPYAQSFEKWSDSNRLDESRLLRGKALQDAQNWSQGKRLSDDDYQFLAASVETDRQQVQQVLEIEKSEAIAARLAQVQKNNWLQRLFLGTVSVALLVTLSLVITVSLQYRQARSRERFATVSEIQALISSAQGNFESHRQLDALEDILRASSVAMTLGEVTPKLIRDLRTTRQWMADRITEQNRMSVGPGLKAFEINHSGKFMVTSSEGGMLKFWSLSGELLRAIPAHQGDINSLQFSPDGQLLLSASTDQTIKLWDVQGNLIQTLIGHQGEVKTAQFSPDGTLIASNGSDRQFILWSADGQRLRDLPRAYLFTWSPESDRLAMVSDRGGIIQILTTEGRLLKRILTISPTYQMAFSPDGTMLAQAAVDQTIRLWNRDGSLIKTLRGHQSTVVRDVTFSPDGRYLASVAADQTVRLWKTPSAQEILQAREAKILLSQALMEVAPTESVFEYGAAVKVLRGHQATVRAVRFGSNSQWLASAGEDGTIRLWQPFRSYATDLVGHLDFISALAVSPDGNTLVSVSSRRQMYFWERGAGGQFSSQNNRQQFSHVAPTRDVLFHPKAPLFATSARNGEIKFWEKGGTLRQTIQESMPVNAIAFSPNGEWFASALDSQVVHLRRRVMTQGDLESPVFSEKPNVILKGHHGAVNSVAFSPDGKQLVTSSADKALRLWNWDDVSETFIFSKLLLGHRAEVRTVAFNPQGDRIASASVDHTVLLWSADGKPLQTLEGHRAPVWDLAFSPTGDQLASASLDGTVKLWSADGHLVRTFSYHNSAVRTVAFSPDGQQLISAGDDQIVRVWDYQVILAMKDSVEACQWGAAYLRHQPRDSTGRQVQCQGLMSVP